MQETSVFAVGFPPEAQLRDIKLHFEKIGNVIDIFRKYSYAIVKYDKVVDAQRAIRKLNGKKFNHGRQIVVEPSRPKRKEQRVIRRDSERPNVNCFNCNKQGHKKFNCPELSKTLDRPRERKWHKKIDKQQQATRRQRSYSSSSEYQRKGRRRSHSNYYSNESYSSYQSRSQSSDFYSRSSSQSYQRNKKKGKSDKKPKEKSHRHKKSHKHNKSRKSDRDRSQSKKNRNKEKKSHHRRSASSSQEKRKSKKYRKRSKSYSDDSNYDRSSNSSLPRQKPATKQHYAPPRNNYPSKRPYFEKPANHSQNDELVQAAKKTRLNPYSGLPSRKQRSVSRSMSSN